MTSTPETVTLDELERLEKAATPAPWKAKPCDYGVESDKDRCDGIEDSTGTDVVVTDSGVYEPNMLTAQLIAASRNALPELLRIVRAFGKDSAPMSHGHGGSECYYCHGYDNDPDKHEASCAWAMARRLVGGVR